ncbi:MAG: branched-chain amino acid ABC transporter permease [Nitrospirae bacterium]|nr:branched-chain amino acid ABC transporter permease [Nitrospirota bacterium]
MNFKSNSLGNYIKNPASHGKKFYSNLVIAAMLTLLILPFMGPAASGIMFLIVMILLTAVSSVKRLKIPSVISSFRLPKIKGIKTISAFVIAAIFLIFPLFLKDYYLDVLSMSGIYIILALGLNVIVGYTGLLNLGFAAFYAIGAYTYAILNTQLGIGFWAALPVSAAFAAAAGTLLAVPALRLKGDYLAIVTLGFGEIVRLVLNNWDSLTKGPNGITGIAPPELAIGHWSLSINKLSYYYYLVMLFVLAALFIIRRVELSRIGRAWKAIRENEIAASSMGINATRYKLYAFAFGTFWAGTAGILFASKMRFVSPESFTFMESVIILSMVILGGIGNTYGVILGAFILTLLPEALREMQLYRMLILGAGIAALMIFKPQGLMGTRIRN